MQPIASFTHKSINKIRFWLLGGGQKITNAENMVAFSVSAFLSLVMFWPVGRLPNFFREKGGDVFHNSWIWGRNLSNILHGDFLVKPNIFFPEKWSSLFSEVELGNTLIYSVSRLFTEDDLIAYTVVFLSAFIGTGWTVTILARLLGSTRLPALLAGAGAAYMAYRYSHYSHVQILSITWALIPILFLGFYLRHPSSFLLVLLFLSCLFVCAGISYNFICFLVTAGFILVVRFWAQSQLGIKIFIRTPDARALAVIGLSCLCFAYIWWGFYDLFIHGNNRDANHNNVYKTDLAWYFGSPSDSLIYGKFSGILHRQSPSAPLAMLFPGFILFIVGCAGVAFGLQRVCRRCPKGESGRDCFLIGLAATSLFFFFISLGQVVTWNGLYLFVNPIFNLTTTTPLLAGTRFIAQFGYFAWVSAFILGAVWLTHFLRLKGWRPHVRFLLMILLLVVAMIENRSSIYNDLHRIIPSLHGPEAVYKYLSTLPAGKSALFLPLPTVLKGTDSSYMRQFDYMLHARRHRLWMVNGISGFFPEIYQNAMRDFAYFPNGNGWKWASQYGLDYIIIDRSAPQIERLDLSRLASSFGRNFKVIYDDNTFFVIELSKAGKADSTNTPEEPNDIKLTLKPVNAPLTVPSNATFDLQLKVTNEGQHYWPLTFDGVGAIQLGVESWKASDGRDVMNPDDLHMRLEARGRLPYDIMPGDSAIVSVKAKTPSEEGTYQLTYGLVVEGVRWVHDKKAPLLRLKVENCR